MICFNKFAVVTIIPPKLRIRICVIMPTWTPESETRSVWDSPVIEPKLRNRFCISESSVNHAIGRSESPLRASWVLNFSVRCVNHFVNTQKPEFLFSDFPWLHTQNQNLCARGESLWIQGSVILRGFTLSGSGDTVTVTVGHEWLIQILMLNSVDSDGDHGPRRIYSNTSYTKAPPFPKGPPLRVPATHGPEGPARTTTKSHWDMAPVTASRVWAPNLPAVRSTVVRLLQGSTLEELICH